MITGKRRTRVTRQEIDEARAELIREDAARREHRRSARAARPKGKEKKGPRKEWVTVPGIQRRVYVLGTNVYDVAHDGSTVFTTPEVPGESGREGDSSQGPRRGYQTPHGEVKSSVPVAETTPTPAQLHDPRIMKHHGGGRPRETTPEVEAKIMELSGEGHSIRVIQARLLTEGERVSVPTVFRVLDRQKQEALL